MLKEGISKYLIVSAFVLLLAISGCVSTTPPAATPTPAPSPTATPGAGVETLKAPTAAQAGRSFEISWKVNSPVEKNITHTAVHYGQESKSEPLTLQSYPNLTKPQSGKIPANFSSNITLNKTGITYFRAHAIIDGANYWSSEMTINVTGAPAATLTPTPTATY